MAAEQSCARAVLNTSEGELRQPVAVYPHRRRGLTLYPEDLECLKPQVYLNDQVINYVLRAYTLRPDGELRHPQIRALDSQFMMRASQGLAGTMDPEIIKANVETLKRWHRNGGAFDVPCVLVPVCEANHWYLLVLMRADEHTAVVYVVDSLGHGVRDRAATVLAQVAGRMIEPSPRVIVGHLPGRRQPNLVDCGLFTLHHARAIVRVVSSGGELTEGMFTGAFEGPVLSREEVMACITETGQPGQPEAIMPPEPATIPSVVVAAADQVLVDGVKLENRRAEEWPLELDALMEVMRLVETAKENLATSGNRRSLFARAIQGEVVRFRVFQRGPVTARVMRP